MPLSRCVRHVPRRGRGGRGPRAWPRPSRPRWRRTSRRAPPRAAGKALRFPRAGRRGEAGRRRPCHGGCSRDLAPRSRGGHGRIARRMPVGSRCWLSNRGQGLPVADEGGHTIGFDAAGEGFVRSATGLALAGVGEAGGSADEHEPVDGLRNGRGHVEGEPSAHRVAQPRSCAGSRARASRRRRRGRRGRWRSARGRPACWSRRARRHRRRAG